MRTTRYYVVCPDFVIGFPTEEAALADAARLDADPGCSYTHRIVTATSVTEARDAYHQLVAAP